MIITAEMQAALRGELDRLFVTKGSMTMTTSHDARCEQLPGGEYHGKTIGGGSDGSRVREPMLIPCHCPARADGRAQAEREITRRRAAIRATLAKRYHGAIDPTEAMIDAVEAGLAGQS